MVNYSGHYTPCTVAMSAKVKMKYKEDKLAISVQGAKKNSWTGTGPTIEEPTGPCTDKSATDKPFLYSNLNLNFWLAQRHKLYSYY